MAPEPLSVPSYLLKSPPDGVEGAVVVSLVFEEQAPPTREREIAAATGIARRGERKRMFLYQPVRVEGTSMLPMLQDQDRLFVNKMAYRVGEIHRGDVVVFLYPHDHTKSYIKRVIALPGDHLHIDAGQVFVNGNRIDEGYVPMRFADNRSQQDTLLLPNDYWVMGDHRSISSDSRDFGPVDRGLIYGKAAFVYWPMDQAGVVR